MAVRVPRSRFAPLETFRCPGYAYLWCASVLWNQARWMDRVTLGWVVLVMNVSAWDLAVIEALRWVPLLIFGLAGGVVADRVDRRWVLIGAQTLALVVCAGIATLVLLGLFTFALAALATFLLGLLWAIDWPRVAHSFRTWWDVSLRSMRWHWTRCR